MVQHTNLTGEFDPGSGRTLAACLTHASRAGFFRERLRSILTGPSGERVSNTWVTCPRDRDNSSKGLLIPDNLLESHGSGSKGWQLRFRVGPRLIS